MVVFFRREQKAGALNGYEGSDRPGWYWLTLEAGLRGLM